MPNKVAHINARTRLWSPQRLYRVMRLPIRTARHAVAPSRQFRRFGDSRLRCLYCSQSALISRRATELLCSAVWSRSMCNFNLIGRPRWMNQRRLLYCRLWTRALAYIRATTMVATSILISHRPIQLRYGVKLASACDRNQNFHDAQSSRARVHTVGMITYCYTTTIAL